MKEISENINSKYNYSNIFMSITVNNSPSLELLSKVSAIENSNSTCFSNKNKKIKSRVKNFFELFINQLKNSDNISQSEVSQLIGMTITPHLSIEFEKKVEFNGVGKILKIKRNSINKLDYETLLKNRLKPLNETPQIVEERIRTPGEAMVDIAGVIKYSNEVLENKESLESLIEKTWLDGSISRQSLNNLTELIKIKTHGNIVIVKEIDNIQSTLEKEFFITKRNDNFYGRLFESELAKYIIKNPNDNMLKIRYTIATFMLKNFATLSHYEQVVLCHKIAEYMIEDPPAWRHNIYCANKFIKNTRIKYFIQMIKYSGEYSIPLILSIAVMYIVFSKGTRELKYEATHYYLNKIKPQRKLIDSPSVSNNTISPAYGLLFSYQKYHLSSDNINSDYGIRPIDRYIRPTMGEDLTEHDMIALSNEKTIGIGISGSSNILHFLFRYLQSKDETFPIDDAKLATASWLTYSGGHSFNEAYSVFGFMSQGNFKPLSFNELKITSELSKQAVSYAYNKVIEASFALSGHSEC